MSADWPSARRLAARIHAGQLTSVSLMEACYDRIEARNPDLNAVVSALPRAQALAQARKADQASPSGPLHGLPLAVKDLAQAAGFPTSMGSPLCPPGPATQDDPHVARLRAAGAVCFGKTNVPAFGLGSHSTNTVFGVTRNPFDPGRSAGGSSGGAAVALATGMAALADGSDMMGSLRNPAVWNGIYGLRPSIGRVPSERMGDRFLNMLSTNGPMARHPEDLALLLDVMSGPDPASQPQGRAGAPVSPALEAASGPLTLGWMGDWGRAWPMEEGLLAAHADALPGFAELGHAVEAVAPPISGDALWDSWRVLRALVVAGSLRAFAGARDRLNPQARWELETGLALGAETILSASQLRADWYRAAMALFERYDALILPAAQVRPFPAHWDWPEEIAGTTMETYHAWMQAVIPASLIGLPCVALPAGLERGLPFGLQVMGPPDSEARLIQIARDWHGLGRQPVAP